MMRLWEFQNGKMGLCGSKIDQDRAKNVNCKILENTILNFLTKIEICQNFNFYIFCSISVNF